MTLPPGVTVQVEPDFEVTFRVKSWVALLPTVLSAVMVIGKLFPAPAVGVPARVAVPSPLSVNVTPAGRAPVSLSPGDGNPVVVTVNVPGEPAVKVAENAEVIAGAEATRRVSVAVVVFTCLELSLTVTTGEYTPATAAVALPESRPVVAFRLNPLGSPVAVQS